MVLTPREWERQFNRRSKELRRAVRESVDDSAAWGANYAAKIAPKDTTTLVQSISFKTIPSNKKPSAMIYIRPLQRPGPNDIRGKTTWYAYQMHNSWPGFRPRNGKDRYFMFTTSKKVSEKFDAKVRFAIGQFIGKQ